MKRVDLENLAEHFDLDEHSFLLMNGYAECIVGVIEQYGRPPIVCYDKNKVISRLMEDDMTEEEAYEFFEYNQLGAWVGDKTPCFLTTK